VGVDRVVVPAVEVPSAIAALVSVGAGARDVLLSGHGSQGTAVSDVVVALNDLNSGVAVARATALLVLDGGDSTLLPPVPGRGSTEVVAHIVVLDVRDVGKGHVLQTLELVVLLGSPVRQEVVGVKGIRLHGVVLGNVGVNLEEVLLTQGVLFAGGVVLSMLGHERHELEVVLVEQGSSGGSANKGGGKE